MTSLEGSLSQEEKEAILTNEMNRFRGRLLGLIESWGLEERRESACKSTLKALSYDTQAVLKSLLTD